MEQQALPRNGRATCNGPVTLTQTTPSSGTRHPAAVLTIILVSYFMIVLDNSIIFTGLPQIADQMQLTPAGLSWVQNAYTLVFGGLLLLGARAGDLLGRRRVFIAGLAVFGVASFLVGAAVRGVADRRSSAAGRRGRDRGAHVARAGHRDHEPRTRAHPCGGRIRRHCRDRRQPGSGGRRRPGGVGVVAGRVLPRRADRGRHDRRCHPLPSRPSPGIRPIRPARRAHFHPRDGRARLRDRRRRRAGVGHRVDSDPAGSRGCPARRVRRHRAASEAADPAPSALRLARAVRRRGGAAW